MNIHVLVTWIEGCQLLRRFLCDVTDHKSFGL